MSFSHFPRGFKLLNGARIPRVPVLVWVPVSNERQHFPALLGVQYLLEQQAQPPHPCGKSTRGLVARSSVELQKSRSHLIPDALERTVHQDGFSS